MSERTKETNSKLTDLCEYDDADTQEEDVDMKINHHDDYLDQDTAMILEDHHNRKDDICFMDRKKMRHLRKIITTRITTKKEPPKISKS